MMKCCLCEKPLDISSQDIKLIIEGELPESVISDFGVGEENNEGKMEWRLYCSTCRHGVLKHLTFKDRKPLRNPLK